MIELSSIYKTFNHGTIDEKVLFSDFDLKINDGEFVAVIGSNGSGKTTLLNIISGSTDVDGGKILLGGREINKMKDYKRAFKIGRGLSGSGAWNMSVHDHLGEPLDSRQQGQTLWTLFRLKPREKGLLPLPARIPGHGSREPIKRARGNALRRSASGAGYDNGDPRTP